MNEEEYKIHITSIINRLIKGKLISPEIKKSKNSNKMEINILISPSEWYHELDDDTKYNVEYNLKKIYTPIIMNSIEEFIKDKEENIETFNNSAKRLKFD
tara:strand:+ start:103 stop:402 length:300 start_codon:yes stop_codon:yes gene_type:complete